MTDITLTVQCPIDQTVIVTRTDDINDPLTNKTRARVGDHVHLVLPLIDRQRHGFSGTCVNGHKWLVQPVHDGFIFWREE